MATRPDPVFKVGDEVAVFHWSYRRTEVPSQISKVVKANKNGIELACGLKVRADGQETHRGRFTPGVRCELATPKHRAAMKEAIRRGEALAIINDIRNWNESGLSTDALVRIADIIKSEASSSYRSAK